MELKKYKLGEILDVTRGASLSGEFYAAEGEYAVSYTHLTLPTRDLV